MSASAVVLLHPARSENARTDEELVRALAAGDRRAAGLLLDRYGPMVERLIRRILGHDPDLEDLVHDAFATILARVHQVREGEALKGWIAQVAVHTAHHAIRRRRAARWLVFWRHDEARADAFPEARDALRRAYAILEHLPAKERIAFALRFLDEMPQGEIARVCDVSVATVKRRLARAERRFVAAASRDPELKGWMEEGDRWRAP